MRISKISLGALLLASAVPAFAQDTGGAGKDPAATPAPPPPAYTVTGGVTAITDYRFRGLTQTNENPAIQGTVNLNTAAGFYVGTWASTIDGVSGNTPLLAGYGHAEVDLYGGYTKTFTGGVGVDVGLLYYFYPGGKSGQNTDFFEPYASLTYTLGPVALKGGLAYAWGGQKGLDFTTGSDDNIYVYGEGSFGIPNTPITLKSHVGYTNGALGLANLKASDDDYYDWSLTAEAVFGKHFKAGVTYLDTDVSNFGGYAQKFGRGATGIGYVGFTF